MTKNCNILKRLLWVLNPQTTDHQSAMLTIIPNEQAVSERHGKTFTILQLWLTDFSWIQLIKWIWYKIEKTRLCRLFFILLPRTWNRSMTWSRRFSLEGKVHYQAREHNWTSYIFFSCVYLQKHKYKCMAWWKLHLHVTKFSPIFKLIKMFSTANGCGAVTLKFIKDQRCHWQKTFHKVVSVN